MNRPSISVAMCTCNGARFVGEQLQSIARQTILPAELVICDDASTDPTPQLLVQFAADSPIPVRRVRNSSKLGCTRNFERAIRLCEGEMIVLADQDDVWKPEKLAVMAEAFAANPGAGYLFSDAEIINQNGELLGFSLWDTVGFDASYFIPGRQVATLLQRNRVTGAAMAFRSALRDILLPIPPAWGHDYWLALLGSIFSFGVPIPQRLFLYRRHLAQQLGCGKDTFLQKVKASMAAEADYYAKTAAMAELHQRAVACARSAHCPLAHLQLVAEKELHLSRRALIRSAHGTARLARLLPEAASGRYQRFSSSWGSMIRDLISPAGLTRPVNGFGTSHAIPDPIRRRA
ncbi:MAG TPA: glycosyltransferase family 2 protein [Terriglobales bacterium]|nr:glycosyltransferase family 2 protein [Terriglobales bacterium]